MAYPVIQVDSNNGSDTCSNASIRGTNASTDGTGLVVTLDGSPDLSGVAIDGSAWIQVLDATAGARNFGKITAIDNTAKTITVSDAFGISLSGLIWAINQTLASLNHTNSRKLFDNNSAAGDAMPGWVINLNDGHTETITSTITIRRSGDMISGPIILASDYTTTRPVITSNFNNSVFNINTSVDYIRIGKFQGIGPGTGSTSSRLINVTNNNSGLLFEDLIIGNSATTNGFAVGINLANGATGRGIIKNVEIKYCSTGIIIGMSAFRLSYLNIHDCIVGVNFSWSNILADISHSLIHHNSGDGIQCFSSVHIFIKHCTIDNNGGDGIEFTGNAAGWLIYATIIESCQITNNGGYAINFTGTGISDEYIANSVSRIFNINHYSNTSGFSNYNLAIAEGTQNIDPQYTDAANGDYTIGDNTKALGYPNDDFQGLNIRSYMDIGALQREEQGSGGSLIHPGMNGGLRA